jgi:hypothetical protein
MPAWSARCSSARSRPGARTTCTSRSLVSTLRCASSRSAPRRCGSGGARGPRSRGATRPPCTRRRRGWRRRPPATRRATSTASRRPGRPAAVRRRRAVGAHRRRGGGVRARGRRLGRGVARAWCRLPGVTSGAHGYVPTLGGVVRLSQLAGEQAEETPRPQASGISQYPTAARPSPRCRWFSEQPPRTTSSSRGSTIANSMSVPRRRASSCSTSRRRASASPVSAMRRQDLRRQRPEARERSHFEAT